ncbi:zinc-dependent alcohol dehydrogenase family protein [Nocardia alba]|uniref:NADPH:quinone reductase-like Zn-dependent oxidoreductase n=1 Tax=Nocardia alba TaxID=225051 RepID=A0A4R1FS41_9NOCA|nr:zinc-dependent alcohol dehydrogenase family protein [Nocardia alba]TCJ96412.1 NADPH:quinone reductase-like Zn-dependent oxidoreductase [Nocardia alba]
MSRVVVFDETGAPEVLRLVDEPVGAPGPGEVRLAVEAVGVNRLDQMIRAGNSPRPIHLPRARLGIEATGTIDAVGSGVQGWAIGDAVIVTAVPDMDTNGTYAEHLVLPADRVVARPAGLDATSAAALWVAYSTAYGALVEKAGVRPGDHVLITAASSGVGLAAIQIAGQIGAVPLAVTRSASKEPALLAAGAATVIVTDRDDIVEATHRFTNGTGADIVLDSVMGPGLADLATAAKRFSGRLITVGWLDPRPAPYPADPITMIRYMSFEHTLDPAAVHRITAFLSAGIRTGALRPVIDTVFTLDDIVAAHRYLERGHHTGKIVVTI